VLAAVAVAVGVALAGAITVVPVPSASGPAAAHAGAPPSSPVLLAVRLATAVPFSAEINGLGCVAGTLNCIVVGDDGHGDGAAAPVADGLPRAARAYPDIAELYGAACTAEGSCLAVGKSAALQAAATGMVASLRPDGGVAPATSTPGVVTSLNAAACPRSCLAVGWAGGPAPGAGTVESIGFDAEPGPARVVRGVGDLLAIGCAPDGTCLAVGYNTKNTAGVVVPISADGTPGRARSVGGTTSLEGVACPAPGACVAVGFMAGRSGSVGVVVAVGPRGTPHRAQRAPGTSVLNGVACSSPVACEAVGWLSTGPNASAGVAAQVAQGRVIGSQTVAEDAALYAISCIPAACLAAGNSASTGFVTLLSPAGNSAPRPSAPPACQPTGQAASLPGVVERLSGVDRDTTAVSVSRYSFPAAGSAGAVVLASNATFPDALAGTPLAVASGGPLLLTPPDELDPAVAAEISRVLPPGGTVYLLGGEAALSSAVAAQVAAQRDVVQRLAGVNRFATAVAVASALGDPSPVLEATGTDFPDALSAGAAAAREGGVVLLTDGRRQAPETAAYLVAHPSAERYAIGHPAAVADPGAVEVSGTDRYETAVRVAQLLLDAPPALDFASGISFPDALAGGAAVGAADGAILLVPACGPLPTSVSDYLGAVGGQVVGARLFGGRRAVGDDVLRQLDQGL